MLLKKILLLTKNSNKKIKFKNEKINNINLNSNNIKKGDLYISLIGKKYKGNSFIKSAINRGAKFVITDNKFGNKNLPVLYDNKIRKKLPILLKYFYKPLPKNLIAITGTNGKTSVSWYLHQLLLLKKLNSSYVGTIGEYYKKNKKSSLEITTPDICSLFKIANNHAQKNSKYFIFEASSHGIDQKRIEGLPINIAVITNISKDHLDYHKNYTSYKSIKLNLFTKFLNKNGTAILNSKINYPLKFKKELKRKSIKIITYGSKKSNIFIENKLNKNYIYINKKKIKIQEKIDNIQIIENLECSFAILLALGLLNKKIIGEINKIKNPSGRMEECYKLNNLSRVFIDFAHTPDAISSILDFVYNKFNKKANILFGCGGDRDKSKRISMGRIANLKANKIYLTDDNPRNENPSKIRSDIYKGCSRAKLIPNRRVAIKIALQELKQNEILIIAGKGHEKYQIIKERKFLFDDLKIANNYIKKINEKSVRK